MNLSLFLNAAEPDPRLALVTAVADMTRRPMPFLTRGDTINVSVVLLNADGSVHPSSGGAGLAAMLTLGQLGCDPMVLTTNLQVVAGPPAGWNGTLVLSADQLTMFLRSAYRGTLVLSFLTFASTFGRTTWCALDCPVLDSSDADTSSLVFSLPNTMPSTFQPAFVELNTGPARLQLLTVSAGDVGKILQGTVAGELKSYQVRVGTDAESLPAIVHPANFDAVVNAFVFVEL